MLRDRDTEEAETWRDERERERFGVMGERARTGEGKREEKEKRTLREKEKYE